jgi:hypothetical protein
MRSLSLAYDEALAAQHMPADSAANLAFNGITSGWVSPTDMSIDGTATRANPDAIAPVFILIFNWGDEKSEHRLLDEPDRVRFSDGTLGSLRTYLDRNIFSLATQGVENFTVPFEQLFPGNLNIVSEERWSTYLARYH